MGVSDKGTWSASDRAQRKRLVQILKEMITKLEKSEPQPLAARTRPRAAA